MSVVLSLGHRRFVGVCLCGVMCLVSVVCVIRNMPCQCLLVLFTDERERKREKERVCVCMRVMHSMQCASTCGT